MKSRKSTSTAALHAHQNMMRALSLPNPSIDSLIQGKRIVYMDIPIHGNVGDLLIMLGTLDYLQRLATPPALITSVYNPCMDAILPGDVLLLHGGGNFGDLYSLHQNFRESIAKRFPNNRIVILPQSIHFSSEACRIQSMSIFSAHQDLHLFVRDKVSHDLAEPLQDRRYLAPDMAHYLYPMRASSKPSKGRLALLRKDIESTYPASSPADHTAVDWHDILGSRHQRIIRLSRSLFKRAKTPGTANAGAALWLRYSSHIAKLAERHFSQHDSVRTDRLHAHILACLMDKPSQALDNSYGKISRYIETWTGESPLVTLSAPEKAQRSSIASHTSAC